ncbi:uncharacterized protein N7496_010516 [Penicillium cataractarum]|uniref:Putative gamma-glutamylcyclotransferase n=1 Tax=Penicillium cataractarum TaxID=2100454 RepID=A0A9W9RQZ1_9EURO|nr:uncharacterized protein N7496_010516 [Penicillium cataractarum]KAJ5364803.1 hypothetical protein N7496_010516 [Penicillium cataractarum]
MTQSPTNTSYPNDPFQEEYYFFYGTLTHPPLLSRILANPHSPDLRPAHITGWPCMMWGDYPALIKSSPNDTITGLAYEVRSIRERERLVQHGTTAYRIEVCTIYFEDGTCTVGKTFVWDGDVDGLREGVFDLRDWLLQEKEFSVR